MAFREFTNHNKLDLCYTRLIFCLELQKGTYRKNQVLFNNLTLEANEKQLKVASKGLKTTTKSRSWQKRQN